MPFGVASTFGFPTAFCLLFLSVIISYFFYFFTSITLPACLPEAFEFGLLQRIIVPKREKGHRAKVQGFSVTYGKADKNVNSFTETTSQHSSVPTAWPVPWPSPRPN